MQQCPPFRPPPPPSARVCTVPTAAQYILRRMHIDPRLAYLLGPGSESFELLTADYAESKGLDVESVRLDVSKNLKFEAWPSDYEIQGRIEDAVAKALAQGGAA